jgi:hypothetical protein
MVPASVFPPFPLVLRCGAGPDAQPDQRANAASQLLCTRTTAWLHQGGLRVGLDPVGVLSGIGEPELVQLATRHDYLVVKRPTV